MMRCPVSRRPVCPAPHKREVTRRARAARAVATGLALALLAAPAPGRAEAAPQQTGTAEELPITLSGSYLAGRYAGQTNDLANAAAFFAEALTADPGNPFLLDRAFVLQLANGDIQEALELAQRLQIEQSDHFIARLLLATDAFRAGEYTNANTLLDSEARGPLAELSSGLIRAWALAATGESSRALNVIARLEGPSWYTVFKSYHTGLIQEQVGQSAAALENFRDAYETDRGALRVIDAYARSLAANGEPQAALDVLAEYDKIVPDHPSLTATRKLIENGETPARMAATPAAGAAEVLYGLGAAIGRDGGEELAAVFLQLALYLDEDADVASIALAALFDRLGNPQRAIDVLEGVREDSPLKRDAEIQIGLNYNALDRLEDARAHLEALVKSDPSDIEAVSALGNVFRARKMFREAEKTYSTGISTLTKPESKHWTLFYYRGICRERLKKWDEAEADFRLSLDLWPDQPLVLNYLGYSLVDQGKKLDEALGMIRKAVKLRPKDGYIVDSLGWAYYRLGRYDDAVRELEKAVELRPEDPVINDHLGDAYWQVGRRLEARFQWNHARDLNPEEDILPLILDKIEKGMAEAEPVPTTKADPSGSGG